MAAPCCHRDVTIVFWNADSWLPDNYQEPVPLCRSICSWLLTRKLYNPFIWTYGDAARFPDAMEDAYCTFDGQFLFSGSEKSELERVYLMLVDVVRRASADEHREKKLLIIGKLSSQGLEMICRLLGSLTKRGCRVLFALPEVDVPTSSGITVFPEHSCLGPRILVWLCPSLFDQPSPPPSHIEPEAGYGDSMSYSIEPPSPEDHAFDFTLPDGVDTCVFWDVQDYPRPPGLRLSRIYDNIISLVHSRASPSPPGGVSIYAYVVKDEDSALLNYEGQAASGIKTKLTVVRNAPADKFARLAKIIMDFGLWTMDNPPKRDTPQPCPRPNLLVISKPCQDDETLRLRNFLLRLEFRGHNVFFALPSKQIPPHVEDHRLPLLSWESLSATGTRKRKAHDY